MFQSSIQSVSMCAVHCMQCVSSHLYSLFLCVQYTACNVFPVIYTVCVYVYSTLHVMCVRVSSCDDGHWDLLSHVLHGGRDVGNVAWSKLCGDHLPVCVCMCVCVFVRDRSGMFGWWD